MTQDQGYIEELIRYIHLNPVRAGICRNIDELDRYRWCGHAVLMEKFDCPFQNTAAILHRFSRNGDSGIPGYREYIQRGISEGEQNDFLTSLRMSNKGKTSRREYGCLVIGDRDFVKKAIARDRKNRLHLSEYIKK